MVSLIGANQEQGIAGDADGAVGFTINATDLAGNALTPVTSVTDGSSMVFDKTIPTLTAVSISGPVEYATRAYYDDDVTITFTSDEAIDTPTCVFRSGVDVIASVFGSDTSGGAATGWECTTTLAEVSEYGLSLIHI